MKSTAEQQLEQYSSNHPQEVLIVKVEQSGQTDEIAFFRGFGSSLMYPTSADPDTPLLAADAKILGIDRLQGPFNPDHPQYLEQNLSWETFQTRFNPL